MKLNRITIQNYQTLATADIDLSRHVLTVVAGDNEVGKSSLLEAICFAITGESPRVALKKNYGHLVTRGADGGLVTVSVDNAAIVRQVQDGKLMGGVDLPVHHLLVPMLTHDYLPGLSPVEFRDLLFRVLVSQVKASDILERIEKTGFQLTGKLRQEVGTMLLAGISAAHDKAKERASDARKLWERLTGDRYGSKKAENWERKTETGAPGAMEEYKERLEAVENGLTEKRAILARLSVSEHVLLCPSCKTGLRYAEGDKPRLYLDGDAKAEEQRHEASVIADEINKLENERLTLQNFIRALNLADDMAEKAKRDTEEATNLHKQIVMFNDLADLLAPDGIPADILAEAILPVKARMVETAEQTGWKLCQLIDLELMVDGMPVRLQSVSSQWRAWATLLEALSFCSGLGLLVLDGFDVLSPANRSVFINWLLTIEKDYDTILVAGTLKEPPKMPEHVGVVWLEQ